MGKTYRRRSDEDHGFKKVKKKKRNQKGKSFYDNDYSSDNGNADYLEWEEKLDRSDRRS